MQSLHAAVLDTKARLHIGLYGGHDLSSSGTDNRDAEEAIAPDDCLHMLSSQRSCGSIRELRVGIGNAEHHTTITNLVQDGQYPSS